MTTIFKSDSSRYWDKNLTVCPIDPGTKFSSMSWQNLIDQVPSVKNRESLIKSYEDYGIGLLTGKKVSEHYNVIGIDIDDDRYVEPVRNMIGGFVSGKKGKKGLTIFALGENKIKKTAIPSKGSRIIDVLSRSICVLPPTVHPETGQPYTWVGTPLYECDLNTLPVVTLEKVTVIKAIIDNPNHSALLEGLATHDPALSLIASLAGKFDDKGLVCECVLALLPSDYKGNLRDEISEMWNSAKYKGLGNGVGDPVAYDPGNGGPIPLGYTDNGYYVFLHQEKRILSILPPAVLMSEPGLCDLAPYQMWKDLCPKITANGIITGIDAKRIGDMLMQQCRAQGPFTPSRARGCGIWLDQGRVVQNLRGEVPRSEFYTYIRFESLPEFRTDCVIDAQKVLDGFSLFNWSDPSAATLLLGWVAIAPICGALKWRPHIFINGEKATGKSTIINNLAEMLKPMAIMVDGTSSEAGIRQSIGADSRPVILDEFESDRNLGRMRSVLKLARSASSASGPIARGTPEGKAMQFQSNTTFCFGAIIPIPGTAADASRIIELELEPHNNDMNIKKKIDQFGKYLADRTTIWPHQMVSLVTPILSSIDLFEDAMPPGVLRHNTNLATLLGAAFVVLNNREPSVAEAESWIAKHSPIITHLLQAHEENDGQDCLNHLLFSRVGNHTIGDLITGKAFTATPEGGIDIGEDWVPRTLSQLGILLQSDGFLVANKHPELAKIFQNTIWADGAWKVPLRRLPGSRNDDKTRARFSGGRQVRCTFVALSALEDAESENIQPVTA